MIISPTYERKRSVIALLGGLLASLIYMGGTWLLSGNLALFAGLTLPALLLGLLLIKHIRLAIAFVVIYAPVEIFVQKWLPDGLAMASRFVSEALLLGLLLAVIADRLLSGKPWKRTPLDVPLVLFVSIGILSAVVNELPPAVLVMGLRITLRYVLLYYLIVQVGFNRRQVGHLLVALLAMAGFVMAVGLLQAAIGQPMTEFLRIPDIIYSDTAMRPLSQFVTGHGRYIFATLGRYDAFGIYSLYIMLIVTAFMLHHRQRSNAWGWLAIASLVCLILSLSRQAWVALYVVFWVWAITGRRKWASVILLTLFVIPALIFLLALVYPEFIRNYSIPELSQATFASRLLSSFSSDYIRVSSSTGGRLFVLRYVSERILELVPLLGFGPGRFGTITAQYFGYRDAALLGMSQSDVYLVFDVNWVTLLGQYGSLGLVAFILIFWQAWRRAVWLYRRTDDSLSRSVALAATGIIPAFLVLGFFGPNFEQRIVAMYAWLMMALVVALSSRQKAHEDRYRE
jgi:hypothetical protein